MPVFTAGSTPSKRAEANDDEQDDEEEETQPRDARRSGGSGGTRNPFQSDAKKRSQPQQSQASKSKPEEGEVVDEDAAEHGEDDEDEQGEDDEDEYDEEDGGEEEEEMDEDDEGDTEYPHWESGPDTVACEQCGEFIPRTQLAQHEKEVCSETPMECPFAHLHCGATAVNRRLLRAHLSRNMPDHIVWIIDRVEEQRIALQHVTEALQAESARRKELERVVEGLTGNKIAHSAGSHSFETPRRGIVGGAARGMLKSSFGDRASSSSSSSSSKRGGGNVSFSPLSSSHSPSTGSSSGGRGPQHAHKDFDASFSLSFDNKPLQLGENRWTPHSISTNAAALPSQSIFPRSLAGTGNSASDEQTRLKVAAGLLPASALALLSPVKPAAASTIAASSSSPSLAPAAAPAAAAAVTPGVDDLPALTKQLKSVLNKLSGNNFEKLSGQVLSILKTVQTAETLTSLVVMLFDKAVVDSYFSNIYSMLCADISSKLPPLHENPAHAFKRFLLNQCQVEFECGVQPLQRQPDQTLEQFMASKTKQKARMLGTIRFIGELYLHELILPTIMTFCIQHLLPSLDWNRSTAATAPSSTTATDPVTSPTPPVDPALVEQEKSDSIEAFCKLLMTIGSRMESSEAGKRLFDCSVFPAIATAQADLTIPSRLRFMLKDLHELRAKLKWKPRKAATQAVANAEKVVTTVEMGLGNGGTIPVPGAAPTGGRGHAHAHGGGGSGGGGGGSSGGRGVVHTGGGGGQQQQQQQVTFRISSNGSGGRTVSAGANYTHHDSHAHNSMAMAASRDDGRRGGGRGSNRRSGGGGGDAPSSASRRPGHPLDSRYDEDEYEDVRGHSGGAGGGQWTRGEQPPQHTEDRDRGHGSGRKSGGGKRR